MPGASAGPQTPGAGAVRPQPSPGDVAFERNLLLSLGWAPHAVMSFERDAMRAGVGPVQAAIAAGALNAAEFYRRLSRFLSFAGTSAPYRVHLPSVPSDAWTLLERPVPLLDGEAGTIVVNGQSLPVSRLITLSRELGSRSRNIKLLTRQDLIDAVTRSYGRVLVGRAVAGLMKERPSWSAKTGLAPWQRYFASIGLGLSVGALVEAPWEALTVTALMLSLFFLLAMILRLTALLNLLFPGKKEKPPPLLRDEQLPRYTVFVPLFKEAAILPHLADALAKLDYPAPKLDIKLVLESVDTATIEAAAALQFPGNVDLIVVPDRQPRTKPKALNYALQFATGDYAVIYDAEDRPEPDQLRKAAAVFHRASPDVVCLQARLDYFNAKDNWLSRQFTIEYATLFRGLLPLLSRFGLPLPLGGTSNHFRIGALRELGAWDPYNVTEDADLGMRLHRSGYRARMLDSTTYEEACCQSMPWIKQRTRWLKGWLQTFGVHMRQPSTALREMKLAGFLAFLAYFAGIIVPALTHPFFYIVLAAETYRGTPFSHAASLRDQLLLAIGVANFAGGYAINLLLGAACLRRSGHRGLWPHAVFIPLYWLYVSAAAYRAVWQLFRAPFYWEKTEHRVSKTFLNAVPAAKSE
jgi:glycosyltransferase involved in cell wall biosynthesis